MATSIFTTEQRNNARRHVHLQTTGIHNNVSKGTNNAKNRAFFVSHGVCYVRKLLL